MWRWLDQDTRSAPNQGDQGGGGCKSATSNMKNDKRRIRTRSTSGVLRGASWIIAATALFCVVTVDLVVGQADAQKGS